jgi:hypothetical protein
MACMTDDELLEFDHSRLCSGVTRDHAAQLLAEHG